MYLTLKEKLYTLTMQRLHRFAKTSTNSLHKNSVTLLLLMARLYLRAQL